MGTFEDLTHKSKNDFFSNLELNAVGTGAGILGANVLEEFKNIKSSSLRGVGAATAVNLADITIDYMASRFGSSKSWYAIEPTENQPYKSTIFGPTMIESLGIATAFAMSWNWKTRLAVTASSWLAGRTVNYMNAHKHELKLD